MGLVWVFVCAHYGVKINPWFLYWFLSDWSKITDSYTDIPMSIMRKKLLVIKHYWVAWSCSGNLCSFLFWRLLLFRVDLQEIGLGSPGLLLYLYRTLEFGSGLFNWTTRSGSYELCTFVFICNKLLHFYHVGAEGFWILNISACFLKMLQFLHPPGLT